MFVKIAALLSNKGRERGGEKEREVLSDFAFGGLAPLHNLLNINDLKSFINMNFASFITTWTVHGIKSCYNNEALQTASCLKLQLKICYRYESKLL